MNWPNRGRAVGYFKNIAIGIDQFIGTFWGISADETISSYCGRMHYEKWQMKAIDWLAFKLFGERDHCLNSIEKQFL